MPKSEDQPVFGRRVLGLAAVLGAALCAHALNEASGRYFDFFLPSFDAVGVPQPELSFFLLYLVYGGAFVALFAIGLDRLGFAQRLGARAMTAVRWKGWVWLLPFIAGATSVVLRLIVLRSQVVTDDEDVYLFTARTLLEGRVINPLPDAPAFFENQFIVLNSHGWFGKYPIGHSIVLALGLLTHATDFVIPLLGGFTAFLTYRLGRAWLSPSRALIALVLVVLSPHFTWTYATLLSQTTSCFALIAALAAVAGRKSPSTQARLAAGLALGFGLLVRPVPNGLFVPLVLWHLWRGDRSTPFVQRLIKQWPTVLPAIAGALIVAAVNAAQAGSPLQSGYIEAHGSFGWFWGGVPGQVSLSVFGAILRENFWLFGWPVSLLPIFFARPRRGRWLLWSPLAVQLIYRIAIPKTVVSTTGPVYIMETMPLLALLAADGLARLRVLLGLWWGRRQARDVLCGAVLSATLASWLMFNPVIASNIAGGADARLIAPNLLAQMGAERAVVFANAMVDRKASLTWAFFPPNPDPALKNPVLYLRWPEGRSEAEVKAYAASHFADRRAFRFIAGPQPQLVPLE